MSFLPLMSFGAGWTEHNDASREFAADIDGAFRDTGLSRKQAAAEMGIGEAQLSRQMQGLEQISGWRLMLLPVTFHAALAKRRAVRVGLVVVEGGSEIAELVKAARVGARALRVRHMAKASMRAARKAS
jgi:hypothetical protein